MTQTEIISAAMKIGCLLLENGAEIYRVEESVRRICYAYGVESADVFAVPNTIILTISAKNKPPMTKTKRIQYITIDLNKMERLNSLCRQICASTPDYQTIMAQIHLIEEIRPYPKWMQIVSFSVITSCFTLFFNGGIYDALAAALIGAILKVLVDNLENIGADQFFIHVLGGTMTAILALVVSRFGLAEDKIIIGTIMTLVPGLSITNSMRDIIAGDFLAGLITFTEALLIGAGIAVGVAIPMVFLKGVL